MCISLFALKITNLALRGSSSVRFTSGSREVASGLLMQLDVTPSVTWDSSVAVKIADSGQADSSPGKDQSSKWEAV